MPSNLSPSREAVERTREDILRRFERMASSDDVRDMLAAAYVVDCAPLVDALQRLTAAADEVSWTNVAARPAEGGYWSFVPTAAVRAARAVLARSAEEPQR